VSYATTAQLIEATTKVILDFNWDNYGLDEVGEIRPADADYARALAAEIVAELEPLR
jgi:hypothetical protein